MCRNSIPWTAHVNISWIKVFLCFGVFFFFLQQTIAGMSDYFCGGTSNPGVGAVGVKDGGCHKRAKCCGLH